MVLIDPKYPSQQTAEKKSKSISFYSLALVLFFVNIANVGMVIYMSLSRATTVFFNELITTYLVNVILFALAMLISITLCVVSRKVIRNSQSKSLIAFNLILLVGVITTVIVFSV